MNIFSNPIIMCGGIALGIILILIVVVIICCKRSALKEREELKALSEEIESEEIVEEVSDNIENVLSKMQEAIDSREEVSVTFEQEQEENAIISYQELLNSLGAKSSIDVDSIQIYEDELDNQIEISECNREIIEAYQREDVEREMYYFQNDYSSSEMPVENVLDEAPVANFNFSDEQQFSEGSDYECKHSPKKFKRTEFISPVYGIINDNDTSVEEEIIFEDDLI